MNLHAQHHTKSPSTSFLLRALGVGVIMLNAALLYGCAENGSEGGPAVSSAVGSSNSTPSTPGNPTSASATLSWDPVADTSVIGYYVHYGTTSPNSAGSCAYQYSQYVTSTTATLSNLSPGSYYFAVSAYNGIEGSCSTEVTTTI